MHSAVPYYKIISEVKKSLRQWSLTHWLFSCNATLKLHCLTFLQDFDAWFNSTSVENTALIERLHAVSWTVLTLRFNHTLDVLKVSFRWEVLISPCYASRCCGRSCCVESSKRWRRNCCPRKKPRFTLASVKCRGSGEYLMIIIITFPQMDFKKGQTGWIGFSCNCTCFRPLLAPLYTCVLRAASPGWSSLSGQWSLP